MCGNISDIYIKKKKTRNIISYIDVFRRGIGLGRQYPKTATMATLWGNVLERFNKTSKQLHLG